MPDYICPHSSTCTIYAGKEDTNGTPLLVYKNVFCKRGEKGWNNCEKYLDIESGQTS